MDTGCVLPFLQTLANITTALILKTMFTVRIIIDYQLVFLNASKNLIITLLDIFTLNKTCLASCSKRDQMDNLYRIEVCKNANRLSTHSSSPKNKKQKKKLLTWAVSSSLPKSGFVTNGSFSFIHTSASYASAMYWCVFTASSRSLPRISALSCMKEI